MMGKGSGKLLAVLFVLMTIGSCVAIINFDSSPLMSFAKCNPIQSVGVEINEFDQNPAGAVSASPYFVGSKNSEVYHYPSCRYVEKIKPEHLIYFDTPEEAIEAGYRPCKVCSPPTKSPPSPPVTHPPSIEPIANFTYVKICAFDQNPADRKDVNEWVALYNPTNSTVNLSNWKLKTKYGGDGGKTVTISEDAKLIPEEEGTNITPHGYRFVICSTGFLRNDNESITLLDPFGTEIDRTCNCIDKENNNRFCMRVPDCLDTNSDKDWIFQAQRLERWKIRRGNVKYVVDGDTIDISPVERAYIQRIRLVGVNTPERGKPGYEAAKNFVNETCFEKEVEFDVDDCKQYDEYHRILAVIYVNVNGTWINLNAELLKKGYAEIMYMPPSEFNPYEWVADCSNSSMSENFKGEITQFYDTSATALQGEKK